MRRPVLSSLSALVGAGLFAQFPAFYRQYLQNLGGRLDQAETQEARVRMAAQRAGLDLEAYLARFAESGEIVFREGGRVAVASLADAERLRAAVAALAEADPITRPAQFLIHLDPAAAAATAERFDPALPLTPEGLAYAAVGFLAGAAVLRLAARAARPLLRRSDGSDEKRSSRGTGS